MGVDGRARDSGADIRRRNAVDGAFFDFGFCRTIDDEGKDADEAQGGASQDLLR